MKKLMMSAVLLLPLVVLMILLVSGSIIGKTTHLYVEGLSFSNPGTLVLVMDDENNPPSEQLEIRVNPSAATNKQLKYSSDKESVVTVSDDGVVTAVDYGQATITVTSVENDAISITRDVLVTDNKIHRLDFTEYPTRIYNSTVSDLKPQLLVNVFPNVYDESVGIPSYVFEFKSSDTNVLRVAQDGVLTPLGVGEATITVSLKDDSSVKPVITQTIKVINPVESITFVKGGDGAAVITASAEAVFPSVKLNSGADEKIEYTSSNPSIATVDETGHICFVNAGRVTITATASDGLGNVKSISKEYTCTKDYYLGNLFPQDRYTVDFDEIMASGGILPISISENPEGAKQEIIEVKFSRDGVVTFDYQTKKFILVGNEKELGEVFVTIRARKYSNENGTIQEFNTDGCLINIERNVQSIEVNFEKESDKVVNFPTVNIMEDFAEHIKAIKVSPTVHTNKFSYEVISGDATVDADGILRFTSPSTVTVAITAINNTSNPASASLTIAYSKIEAGDKRLEYDGVENQQKNLTLNIYEEDNKEKGVIVFTSLPDGVTTADLNYTIISGKDILGLEKDEEDGTIKIVPLKGGYGTVEITANISGKSGRATNTWVVIVYVDRQVEKITLTPNADVTTSLTSYPYKVEVFPADAMAGKELHITGVADPVTSATYNGSLEFGSQGSKTLKVFVSYAGRSDAITGTTVSRTITSTMGTLIEYPKITCEDTSAELSVAGPNEFTLNNIGQSIRFKIDTSSFIPSDYVLKASDVSVSVNTKYISYTISADGATVTLTGVNGCEGELVEIKVKNKTFILNGTVVAKADYLNVTYDNIVFESGEGDYLTFVDAITFKVTPARRDGKTVTDDAILRWTYGATGGDSAIGNVGVMLENSDNAYENKITFTYGELTFVVNVQKVSAVNDFGVQAYYTDGEEKKLSPIESIANQEEEIYYKFPSNIQNQFTLRIILPNNVIGGLGTDDTASGLFAKTFNISGFDDWQVSYDPFNARITLIATTKTERTINIHHGSINQNITFGFIDIRRIDALGFSMDKEDVYLGYQQVRVFAKHSYYNDETVNYFKIPLDVHDGTLRYLNFKIERYVDETRESVITTQDGYTVISGGATYTIRKVDGNGNEYGLFDASGNNVSNSGITWVDVFSEQDYARIYFGDFAGLSESDVYNDYFGNFGEQADWKPYTQIKDDGSGRTFTPSPNAGAFMRIEANDGIEGSNVSWHYNFNVLDDTDLTNVETAKGYLAFPNGKVVLQHSLYGRGERKDSNGNPLPDDDYTLEKIIGIETCEKKDNGNYHYNFAWWEKNALEKELIYGNGFQINFETYNRQAINAYEGKPETTWYPVDDLQKNKVTSNGENNLFFGSFINVTIKGANVDETGRNDTEVYAINFATSAWDWFTHYCYYSNIMAWRKGLDVWGGHTAYVKNVTMRYMPEFAIKINNDSTGYIENIVIAESAMAIRNGGSNAKIFFKGYQDIFCYSVPEGIISTLVSKDLVSAAKLAMSKALQSVYNYSEWFGYDGSTSTSDYRYINAVVLCENEGATKREMYFWNESEQTYKGSLGGYNTGDLRQGANDKILTIEVAIWSYENLSSIDGGKTEFQAGLIPGISKPKKDTAVRDNWDKLFTDERYIRLLCEYKTKTDKGVLVSNGEHLQWHFNRAYRDSSLVGADGWHYEDHITNLKESLVGVIWKDAKGNTSSADEVIKKDNENRANAKNAVAYLTTPQKPTEFILPRTKSE